MLRIRYRTFSFDLRNPRKGKRFLAIGYPFCGLPCLLQWNELTVPLFYTVLYLRDGRQSFVACDGNYWLNNKSTLNVQADIYTCRGEMYTQTERWSVRMQYFVYLFTLWRNNFKGAKSRTAGMLQKKKFFFFLQFCICYLFQSSWAITTIVYFRHVIGYLLFFTIIS